MLVTTITIINTIVWLNGPQKDKVMKRKVVSSMS